MEKTRYAERNVAELDKVADGTYVFLGDYKKKM